jgi:hypothetical protein
MLADDLSHVATCQRHGIIYAVGWKSGTFYCQRSDDNGYSQLELNNAGDYSIAITAGEEEQPGLCLLPSGVIVVAIPTADACEIWVSKTGGCTWALTSVV